MRATFLSVLPSTNPTHWPSGEVKTQFSGAAPVKIAVASSRSSGRTKSWLLLPTYTTRVPSGVMATLRPVAMSSAALPDDAIVVREMRGGATWFAGCRLK